jgi:hypothetical protein
MRLAALTAVTICALCGCAGSGATSGGAPPETRPRPSPTVELQPDSAAFSQFEAQCRRQTSSFLNGRVVWPHTATMPINQGSPVKVVVTLDPAANASALLPGATISEQPVQVTCGVRASVEFDQSWFTIPDSEPPQFRSLLPSGEASWTWEVTPKVNEQHTIIFKLEPIVLIGPDGNPQPTTTSDSNAQFSCVVSVTQPPDKRVIGLVGRTTAVMNSLKAMFIALGGALAAALTAWYALRRRRKPNAGAESTAETNGNPEHSYDTPSTTTEQTDRPV